MNKVKYYFFIFCFLIPAIVFAQDSTGIEILIKPVGGEVNSAADELAPIYYNDGTKEALFFVRGNHPDNLGLYQDVGGQFSNTEDANMVGDKVIGVDQDIWVSEKTANGWGEAKAVEAPNRHGYYNVICGFSEKGDTMYVTYYDFRKPDKPESHRAYRFGQPAFCTRIGDDLTKWTEPEPINIEGYNEMNIIENSYMYFYVDPKLRFLIASLHVKADKKEDDEEENLYIAPFKDIVNGKPSFGRLELIKGLDKSKTGKDRYGKTHETAPFVTEDEDNFYLYFARGKEYEDKEDNKSHFSSSLFVVQHEKSDDDNWAKWTKEKKVDDFIGGGKLFTNSETINHDGNEFDNYLILRGDRFDDGNIREYVRKLGYFSSNRKDRNPTVTLADIYAFDVMPHFQIIVNTKYCDDGTEVQANVTLEGVGTEKGKSSNFYLKGWDKVKTYNINASFRGERGLLTADTSITITDLSYEAPIVVDLCFSEPEEERFDYTQNVYFAFDHPRRGCVPSQISSVPIVSSGRDANFYPNGKPWYKSDSYKNLVDTLKMFKGNIEEIKLTAYTDVIGEDSLSKAQYPDYNKHLAQRRACRVHFELLKALKEAGIDVTVNKLDGYDDCENCDNAEYIFKEEEENINVSVVLEPVGATGTEDDETRAKSRTVKIEMLFKDLPSSR